MNTPNSPALSHSPKIQSIKETNPKLFNRLVDHPNIMVVDCYCQLESLQFHTMYYVFERLLGAGYSKETIKAALAIYMDA